MLIPPEATNIRIRIFNESQNIVRDVKIPSEGTTMVRIDLPAAVYNIHALAYLIANSNEGVVLTAGEARNPHSAPLALEKFD
jgi:type 1 fimbria pilin